MPVILHIETSTRVCSVALSRDGALLSIREDHSEEYSHSSLLTVFMDEVIKDSGLRPEDVSAVAVSQGPGSYTGLRIGVSAAKGFCYALEIPLIAVDTMRSMAREALRHVEEQDDLINPRALNALFCPMIDARRMEVYCAIFDARLEEVMDTRAVILDGSCFMRELFDRTMYFFGDGASKCRNVVDHPNALYLDSVHPSARGMIAEAEYKFHDGDFADLAYFEPFYLKDFVAGKPKVKGLSS